MVMVPACDIPLSQLPVPCINEDAIAVTILKEEYKEDNNLGTISLEKDGAVNNNEFVSPIVQQDLRIVSRLWVNEVEEEDIGTS
ncbi:hypothetical protein JHK85_010582 [Glycine max]|nr:hypothetical protein JHK85_010582 [Glycine max]KAG5066568.1 hypothetical protein JHK86_010299 [Glycine max]